MQIMKTVGIILLVFGIIGIIVFGIQAINDSESFSLLGLDIAVSQADWTPLIISAVITLIGGILTGIGKKA
jgi:hypothetical protein